MNKKITQIFKTHKLLEKNQQKKEKMEGERERSDTFLFLDIIIYHFSDHLLILIYFSLIYLFWL